MMYAEACTPMRTNENSLLAVVNSIRSSGLDMSAPIMPEPASSWSMSPAVTMGPIPSSMRLPRWLANITLRYWNGSPVVVAGIPYSGISAMMR